MPPPLPLSYDECRSRFRWTAHDAGIPTAAHPIEARGPNDEILTIDVAAMGSSAPRRALVVMSGVHGVEGYISSAIQCDLLERVTQTDLPADLQVLFIHAVNPWGMAWWRRQNESNVDLNRNWNRDGIEPPDNPGYREIHPFLCPESETVPTPESFLDRSRVLVEERGLPWVRDAVSVGQYSHADGLHFGGHRTEESTRIVAGVVGERLSGVERSFCVDLHTGHGAWGTYTILADSPPGSEPHTWLGRHFDTDRIEATVDNPDATTSHKVGQIGYSLTDVLDGTEHRAITFELGTVSDTRMVLAQRAENWVHHHGDRSDPDQREIVRTNRRCYSPDDPGWTDQARVHGRTVLDAALRAMSE